MAVDRDEILKKAEKLLKQGKVSAAIEEYVRLVEDKPTDWNLANTLGDLYLKAGEAERAAEQFTRAADHLYGEGFFPRAAAVYKKVLRVRSGDDHAVWQLADIAGRNGLSLDARSHYARLIQDRRAAGNEPGAVDCLIRLGLLADANVDAKRVAASALVDRGELGQAARLVLSIADTLTTEGRLPEALDAFTEAARLDPHNLEIREKLAAAEPAPVETIATFVEEIAPVEEVSEAVVKTADEPGEIWAPEPEEVDPALVLTAIAASSDPDLGALGEALPLESFFE